jgi:hypothetical protein
MKTPGSVDLVGPRDAAIVRKEAHAHHKKEDDENVERRDGALVQVKVAKVDQPHSRVEKKAKQHQLSRQRMKTASHSLAADAKTRASTSVVDRSRATGEASSIQRSSRTRRMTAKSFRSAAKIGPAEPGTRCGMAARQHFYF